MRRPRLIPPSDRLPVHTATTDFEKDWAETTAGLSSYGFDSHALSSPLTTPVPEYRHPGKKWRLKRGAVPQWYKSRNGVRSHALSGAARVARHRPKPMNPRT